MENQPIARLEDSVLQYLNETFKDESTELLIGHVLSLYLRFNKDSSEVEKAIKHRYDENEQKNIFHLKSRIRSLAYKIFGGLSNADDFDSFKKFCMETFPVTLSSFSSKKTPTNIKYDLKPIQDEDPLLSNLFNSNEPLIYYHLYGSPVCRATSALLKLLNIKHEEIQVQLFIGEQHRPEYVEMNPQSCVPMIEDNGFCLWESRSILRYFVDKYGKGSTLYPEGLKIRSKINNLLDFDTTLFPILRQYIFPVLFEMKTIHDLDNDNLMKLEIKLNALVALLKQTKFVACDFLTIADLAVLGTLLNGYVVGYNYEKFPVIENWMKYVKDSIPKEIYDVCYFDSIDARKKLMIRTKEQYEAFRNRQKFRLFKD